MSWTENRRQLGYKDRLIWISPEAEEALQSIKGNNPDASYADIINQAVVQYSALGFKTIRHEILKFDFWEAMEELFTRVGELESRLPIESPSSIHQPGEDHHFIDGIL